MVVVKPNHCWCLPLPTDIPHNALLWRLRQFPIPTTSYNPVHSNLSPSLMGVCKNLATVVVTH